jgi:hypothetical protein
VTWLTIREAARRVGRDVRTIKRWHAAGMPMRTIDGHLEVDEETLLATFREHLARSPVHQERLKSVRVQAPWTGWDTP